MATFEIDGKMTVEELIKLLAPKLTPDLFTTPLPQEDMIEVEFTDESIFSGSQTSVREAMSRMFSGSFFVCSIYYNDKKVKEVAPAFVDKTATLVVTKDMTVKELRSRIEQKFGFTMQVEHMGRNGARVWPDKCTLESIGLLDPFKIVKK